jgi:exopolysaccharide biosynthesis protein
MVRVADGVVYRTFGAHDPMARGTEVWLIDIDLSRPGVQVSVAAHGLRRGEAPATGDARTAAEWCAGTGAVAAVNGGYFGAGDDARKEIVGLLVQRGRVVSSASVRRGDRGSYVRSVFGASSRGVPAIRWATGSRGAVRLRGHRGPTDAASAGAWSPASAVGCGPRLISGGKVKVADRAERLVSPGRVPRTFVGYSLSRGRPAHLVLAVGQRMDYADAAAFLKAYFRGFHRAACAEAMCVDGGGSSQMAYREGEHIRMPISSLVTTPTAIVVRVRPGR